MAQTRFISIIIIVIVIIQSQTEIFSFGLSIDTMPVGYGYRPQWSEAAANSWNNPKMSPQHGTRIQMVQET